MTTSPFTWGAAGQHLSPGQTKKYRDIEEALIAKGGTPTTLGAGLNRVGEALLAKSYDARATDGETEGAASRKAVMDALLANPDPSMTDIAGSMSNEWVASDPGSQAVVQALMGQEQQQQGWAHDATVRDDQRAYDAPLRDIQLQTGQQGLDQSAAAAPLDLKYKQAQIDALSAKPPVTPTGDIQEYEMAKTQGFQGTLQDWIAAKPRASGVVVNTGDNSGAFNKKSDELAAARLGDIVTSGQGASQMMGDIKTLAALGSQINTGKGAEIMNQLGPFAQAMGIDISGLSEGQAFQSVIDRMAPNMRPVGSGSSSDTDVRMFLNSLPGLGKTPEGNQIIIQTLSALQQHKLAAADIAGLSFSPPDAPGHISWQEAEKRIRELPDPYEGFNAYKATLDKGAAPPATDATTAPAAPGQVPEGVDPSMWGVMTPEERALWQ